jgi:hypothetical protein
VQERETQLKEQVTSLDSQLQAMKPELEKARAGLASSSSARSYPTPRSSLNHSSIRPTSVVSHRRSQQPSPDEDDAKTERDGNSDKEEGVWGSMHAPKRIPPPPARVPSTPRPIQARALPFPRSFAPPAGISPSLTSVSLAPTQGEDGWWS